MIGIVSYMLPRRYSFLFFQCESHNKELEEKVTKLTEDLEREKEGKKELETENEMLRESLRKEREAQRLSDKRLHQLQVTVKKV